AEVGLEEAPDLAAPPADQRQHDDVGLGAAGHHAEQRALADAAAAEHADALPASARQHGVDRAHAGPDGRPDRLARHGIERVRAERRLIDGAERPLAVDRPAETVDDAAEQRRAHGHGERVAARDDRIARADAGGVAKRHREQTAVAEADDFD